MDRLKLNERGKLKRKRDLAKHLKVSYQTIQNVLETRRILFYAPDIIKYIDENIEPTDHLIIKEDNKEYKLTVKK